MHSKVNFKEGQIFFHNLISECEVWTSHNFRFKEGLCKIPFWKLKHFTIILDKVLLINADSETTTEINIGQ